MDENNKVPKQGPDGEPGDGKPADPVKRRIPGVRMLLRGILEKLHNVELILYVLLHRDRAHQNVQISAGSGEIRDEGHKCQRS